MAEQEMSVHDKQHPALGPSEAEQDVDSLAVNIVPPGAYVDPNDVNQLNNSVNISVNDHPNPLAADYGETAGSYTGVDAPQTTLSLNEGSGGEDGSDNDAPEDRDEWKKSHWVAQAGEYGLAKSGNTDDVKKRVEEYEAFEEEVSAASRADLDDMAGNYDLDPSEYSTKEKLAEAIMAAEFGKDVPPGDKTAQ